MGGRVNADQRNGRDEKKNSNKMRAMDCLAGSALLVLFLPSLVVVALTTMLCNSGVAFRRVSRTSECGRTVTVLNYHCGNAGPPANRYDQFLVETRLVTLPEIFNVVTGELSFFDPNAARPSLFRS